MYIGIKVKGKNPLKHRVFNKMHDFLYLRSISVKLRCMGGVSLVNFGVSQLHPGFTAPTTTLNTDSHHKAVEHQHYIGKMQSSSNSMHKQKC